MRWLGRLVTSLAAVALTAGGAPAMPASGAADAAWADAEERGTLEAYAAFVMGYPQSKHAATAYGLLSGAGADAAAEDAEIPTIEADKSWLPDILSKGMIFIGS